MVERHTFDCDSQSFTAGCDMEFGVGRIRMRHRAVLLPCGGEDGRRSDEGALVDDGNEEQLKAERKTPHPNTNTNTNPNPLKGERGQTQRIVASRAKLPLFN